MTSPLLPPPEQNRSSSWAAGIHVKRALGQPISPPRRPTRSGLPYLSFYLVNVAKGAIITGPEEHSEDSFWHCHLASEEVAVLLRSANAEGKEGGLTPGELDRT